MFGDELLMGAAGQGGGPPAMAYVSQAGMATDFTTYTFSGQGIGTASADREVIVAFSCSGGGTQLINTMTIGGISATEHIEQGNTDGEMASAIYSANVPTGTTADIVVVLNRSAGRAHVAVWEATGISVTPNDTKSDNAAASAADPSVSINCPATGFIIAYTSSTGGSGSTYTWAGVTEDFDTGPIEFSYTASGASDVFATQQTGLTVAPTWSDSLSKGCLVVASWGP